MRFRLLIIGILVILIGITLKFALRKTESVQASKKVTLRLQWHTQMQFAGYYMALDRGLYKDVGLDVTIEQGGYGKNCLTTVKEKLEEFGTKWMADLVVADTTLISIANIVKDNGLLMVSKKDKGVKTISDFQNKTVSIWFIGNEYQLFALLDKYGVNKESVNIIPQKWDLSQFFNDEVDIVAAMTYNELIQIQKAGFKLEELNIFTFSELDVGFPGQNIFTSKAYLRKHPDICKNFVQASLAGWQYAIENPKTAAKIILKYDKENILDYETQYAQMLEISKLIQPDQHEIGSFNEEQYQNIEKIFKQYNIIPNDFDSKSIYTKTLLK